MNGTQAKAEIKLRTDVFDTACNARGWFNDAVRARELDLAKSVMSRLRNRQGSASAEAVDKVVRGLELPYQVLFERVEVA